MMTNLIGQSLGRYHILEQLGEGGMAVVYKAYDTRLESEVAVKVIRTESLPQNSIARALKRFEREAKVLARLTHPNIVKVIDYGEYDGKPYLVMPYLPGGTLKQTLGKPIPWPEALQLLHPIARALDFAHRQGMVHRDVKPSNILITADGEPMLTDFGIAKVLDAEETLDLTGTNAAMGTPEYMAPEQAIAKTADHRADIYALGIILYEMVTGRKPYSADTPMAVMIMHARDPLPRPSQYVSNLPDGVEKMLMKALAKEPVDRYKNVAEMANAMEKLVAGSLVHGPSKRKVKLNSSQKALDRNVDDNVSAIVMEIPGGKRPVRSPTKTRIIAAVTAAILILGILGIMIISKIISTPPPALSTVTGNQIYVAQVWHLSLNILSSTGSSQPAQSGALLNFEQGENIQTTSGNGYAYFGLPGQAQLYLAGSTDVTLKGISDSQFEILLNQGSILVNQPGRKFLIDTPNGAQAWVSGSMMGLRYDTNTQELYIDCLEDKCWYGNNQHLPAGFSAVMKGIQIISSGPGTRNELWQFVPNLVATPTSTMTPSATPNIGATQTCGYLQNQGTPCPPPR